MVMDHEVENGLPAPDEDWWASILAEEERYLIEHVSRPAYRERALEERLNWERARMLFQRDEVVALQVVAYNQGGLLVRGDGLRGFVPFSHLLNVDATADGRRREKMLAAYVGKTLRLKVIECVPEEGRVVFSERAAQAGAGRRTKLFATLQAGQCVEGVVTNVTDFGAFVDLGGVEGLIHISELSWGRVVHPSQIVKIGDRVRVQVLDVSPERCRIALSLKRLQENPWETAESVYRVNRIVPAVITAIVSYGAFARLENGLEGLIHVSEMPLAPGETVRDLVKEGQTVQVRVLHVDAARQRLGLSLRLDEV